MHFYIPILLGILSLITGVTAHYGYNNYYNSLAARHFVPVSAHQARAQARDAIPDAYSNDDDNEYLNLLATRNSHLLAARQIEAQISRLERRGKRNWKCTSCGTRMNANSTPKNCVGCGSRGTLEEY
jgi:rubrerythrin